MTISSNASFIIGDYDDSDSDIDNNCRPVKPRDVVSIETQTEPMEDDQGKGACIAAGPPRALEECVALMKSDVSVANVHHQEKTKFLGVWGVLSWNDSRFENFICLI